MFKIRPFHAFRRRCKSVILQARSTTSSAKIVIERKRDPNVMLPSSNCTFSIASTASEKKMMNNSGLRIQPSRVPCVILKRELVPPSGSRTIALMSSYSAVTLFYVDKRNTKRVHFEEKELATDAWESFPNVDETRKKRQDDCLSPSENEKLR